MTPSTLTIDPRYCGPPDSGNGGYVCGCLAREHPAAVTVRLKRPPPLGKPLTWTGQQLSDESSAIAEATPDPSFDLPLPEPVSPKDAEAASQNYLGFSGHPFPRCYVCGPQRKTGDGLRVFPGRLSGKNMVAAPWTPSAATAAEQERVGSEHLWACLDCPGYFALVDRMQPALLAEMTARIVRPLLVLEPCVVVGWPLGIEGRKWHAGTALWTARGELVGYSRQLWIQPRN